MTKDNDINLISFNCKGFKSSIIELKHWTQYTEIICLQETWLDKSETSILGNSFEHFLGFGISQANHETGVTLGRKSGGIGILWKNNKINAKCMDFKEEWI